MNIETLGELIRARRGEKLLSLRALARQVDITAAFLSDVESGKRFPSAGVLARIAAALEIAPDAFAPFDHRQLMKDLRKLLTNKPGLTRVLSNMVTDVRTGELTVDDLVIRLTGSITAKNPSLPAG